MSAFTAKVKYAAVIGRSVISTKSRLSKTKESNLRFLTYLCRNCRAKPSMKVFALAIEGDESEGLVRKIGELRAFGPPTPSRVFQLIGESTESYFCKAEGRRIGD